MLTQAYQTFEKPGLVVSYKLAAVKVFKGAMVGLNNAGYLAPMHASAGLRFVGIAGETVDNFAGQSGDKSVNVAKAGSFVMACDEGYVPLQADLGLPVYAKTDWTVARFALPPGPGMGVGTIVGIETTSTGHPGVRIRIDNHVC